MGPSACHITNNLRLIYFKAARNDYEIITLHRTDSRKSVLDWALQQMGLELHRADLCVLPYSSLKALYFTLTWRGKVQLSTHMTQGHLEEAALSILGPRLTFHLCGTLLRWNHLQCSF